MGILKKYISRKKELEAAKLQKQLEEEMDRNARLAGYCLFPKGSKVVVQNVPNSSDYKTPNGDTCLGYWEKNTGFKIEKDAEFYCPACGNKMSKKYDNLDGAHVYKFGKQNEWYFVPLCSACNNPTNTTVMTIDTVLVPVPDECYEKKQNVCVAKDVVPYAVVTW